MDEKVYVNEKRVRLSGSIVAIKDEPVKFSLSDNFVVVFKFAHDDNQKGRRRYANVIDKELVITFVNYEDQLGSANSESVVLGTIDGVKIYMNFALFLIGDEARHTRVVHYTFLESPEVQGKGSVA